MAVERLNNCENVVVLAQELGVHRRLLYYWRDQGEAVEGAESSTPVNPREAELETENSQLRHLLAEKVLEVNFFKGALQKVEARRRNSEIAGETASTTKSKK
jgi:transposase-like protein